MNKKNTGDSVCSPLDFFNFEREFSHLNIGAKFPAELELNKNDVVIIGGGGLFNYSSNWNKRISRVLDSKCKVIFWGAGENSHYDDKTNKPQIVFHENCLIGLRDRNAPKEFFLPCVSCMSKHFDVFQRGLNGTNHIGAICHKDITNLKHFCEKNKLPYVENNATFDSIIQHIGSLDLVLVNTYHGAYWSQLMGKKTIIVKPFSTRFDNLPLDSLVINDFNEYTLSKMIEEANLKSLTDENLLYNCRKLNVDFFEKVKKFIG